jgi:hypothetical protein
MSLRELANKKLDIGFFVDCRNEQLAGCTGTLWVGLGYASPDCGIIRADVMIQGLPVPQSSPGGWQGCAPYASDDCQKVCKTPTWEGDISPVLDQIAETAVIEMSDGDTSLLLNASEPTTMATIQPRGLLPGDTVASTDLLIADLAPVFATTAEEFQGATAGQPRRDVRVSLYQNGHRFDPPPGTMTLQLADGSWAFETLLFFPDTRPVAGEAILDFSLHTHQLDLPACPVDTTCRGTGKREMLEFPIVYEP